MDATLANALINAGPIGVFAAYLIWDRWNTAKDRNQLDRDRLEVDRHVAASLSALTAVIQQQAKRDA